MSGVIALCCGVDEAGRGPLAGPVMAAAVILGETHGIAGLDDSKKLSAQVRAALEIEIKARAVAWSVASASVEEIDAINILQASLLAMRRAVEGLALMPAVALVDGLHCPQLSCAAQAIVGGDATVPEISAASILAKTARDALMCELDLVYPEYGFARHKGYPTAAHLSALRAHGVTPAHRRSFAPVRELVEAAAGGALTRARRSAS
jgi:ribonuclease HII